jgi:hypothetical protein
MPVHEMADDQGERGCSEPGGRVAVGEEGTDDRGVGHRRDDAALLDRAQARGGQRSRVHPERVIPSGEQQERRLRLVEESPFFCGLNPLV